MSRGGFTQADVPDQSGKCFVVTGANTGIGFETSRVRARRGARVLLACRDRSKAEAAMARIKQESPKADLEFLPLDLADLDSVQRAADLAAEEARIDVLVNNADVLMPPLTRTKQGFELQFGVNYLGTFALTTLLLPKLSERPAGPSGGNFEWGPERRQDRLGRSRRERQLYPFAQARFFSKLLEECRVRNHSVASCSARSWKRPPGKNS